MLTFASLFSGGGVVECLLPSIGVQPVWALECDREIADVHILNFPDTLMEVEYAELADFAWSPYTDIGWASPPCTRASVANPKAGESELDIRMAEAVCEYLRLYKPNWFFLENVQAYGKFESFKKICAQLQVLGYNFTHSTVNAADFGVPQTRRRLILRSVRNGGLPKIVPTHSEHGDGDSGGLFGSPSLKPWNGWYAAVDDLLDGLEETRLAKWQTDRLPAELKETLLIDGDAAGERAPTTRKADEPATTVKCPGGGRVSRAVLVHGTEMRNMPTVDESAPAFTVMAGSGRNANKPRAILIGDQYANYAGNGERELLTASAILFDGKPDSFGGDLRVLGGDEPCVTITSSIPKHPLRAFTGVRIMRIDERCCARFQSIPDWYKLPAKKSLASRIIGNAVPSLLALAVVAQTLGVPYATKEQ